MSATEERYQIIVRHSLIFDAVMQQTCNHEIGVGAARRFSEQQRDSDK
jgi:hypothetical protein